MSLLIPTREPGAGVIVPTLGAASFYQHTQLTIPTYESSGQATHPAVLRVEGGWRGWRYWMAMTPLPDNDETFEDPSVLVSQDGVTWQLPPGGPDPVILASATSDPELVYWDNRLYLFWRTSGPGPGDAIHVTSTSDGVTWSGDTTILTGANTELLSPAVVRHPDGTWRLWAVNMTASPNTLRMWTATDPLGTWTGPTACTATDPEGRDLWHCDVNWDGTAYRMLLTTCGSGNSGDFSRLLLGSSTNATTWSFSGAVLTPPGGSEFDSYSTGYHASGFLEQDRWRVWYGGQQVVTAEWHIGYTEVDPADFP